MPTLSRISNGPATGNATPATGGATTSQGPAAAPAPQAADPSLERVRALQSAGFRDLAFAELQAFIKALGLAGIDSLNDLRRRSASSLVPVFRDWSPALHVAPPSPQQIEEWVVEVSALSPLV